MSIESTFHIGDKIVYPLHGSGQVENIFTRAIEGSPQRFYQIILEKNQAAVLLSAHNAGTLGLRPALTSSQVQGAMEQLQQSASRVPGRGQSAKHYTWCKERLRQGDALGLAEVRRFLYDLERVESFSNPHLRQLRVYVHTQLVAEIAQALGCAPDTAAQMVDTALTSEDAVTLSCPTATRAGEDSA